MQNERAAQGGSFAVLWNAPYVLLVFAVLFWAGNFIVGRFIAPVAPPLAMAFWRWFLALGLIVWFGRGHIRRDFPILLRHFPTLLLLSILGISCFNSFVYIGLHSTTSVNALLFQAAIPVLIFVANFALFGEKPLGRQIAGVVVAVCGVALIAVRGRLSDLLNLSLNPGDAWILASVVSYALYSALLRKRPAVHPLSFLGATFLLGSLCILPFYIHEDLSGAVLPLTPTTSAALAYLVVFPSFLSYLFFNRGVELVGAGRAGAMVYLLPVFGSLLAVVFLGERLQAYHFAAGGLIAAGLVISAFGTGRKRDK